jgi:hypothetical protein
MEDQRRLRRQEFTDQWYAEFGTQSDGALVKRAGEGDGEPRARGQAQAELMVRLRRSIDQLRDETATSSRRMVQLTWVLVGLTVIIAALTVVLLLKA